MNFTYEQLDYYFKKKKQGFEEVNYLKTYYLFEENEETRKKIKEKVVEFYCRLLGYSSVPFFIACVIGGIYNDFIIKYNNLAISTVFYWFANLILIAFVNIKFENDDYFPGSYNRPLSEINTNINFIYSLNKNIEAENLIKRIENVPKKYSNSKRKRIFEKINEESQLIVDELFSQVNSVNL